MEANVWTSRCAAGNCVEVKWLEVKWLTACSSSGCVEVAHQDGRVLVRDGKLGDESPVIEYSLAEWDEFRERWTANPITDPDLKILLSAAGGGWVWQRGGSELLRFTDVEIQEFGDALRAGTFDLEVKP